MATTAAISGDAAMAGANAKSTSWAPTAKVSAGGVAGAITMLVTLVLKARIKDLGLAPETIAAITTIVTFVVQYLVPERT